MRIYKIDINRIKAIVSRKLSLIIYGNSLGIKTNRIWAQYEKACKNSFEKKSPNSKIAQSLVETRLCILGQSNSEKLQNFVHSYFSSGKGVVLPETPQLINMDIEFQAKTATWIYEVLKEFSEPIESFFDSHFQPYWITIQKTIPGDTKADTSFGWHFDDNPKQYIKIFIYLNDVSENNGAFRAFDLKSTKSMISKGFKSYSKEERIASQDIVNDYLRLNPISLKILEGKAGSVLAFDNNLIHKGTAPREGFRYAVQIPIIPSMNPIRLDQVERALCSPKKHDYPVNPFQNDFGY